MSRNFNGSSDYINIGSNTVPKPPMTVFSWIKIPTFAVEGKIIARWDDSGSNSHFLLNTNTDSTIGFIVKNSSDLNRWGRKSGTLSTGIWYAVAGVSDNIGLTGVKVYINGVAYSNVWVDDDIGTNANSTQLTLGAGQDGASMINHFNGVMAETAIWNVLLTDNEIAMLSRGICPVRVRPANLYSYHPLYGASSPEVDLSGNLRNGTVTGTTQVDHPSIVPPFGFDMGWMGAYTVPAGGGISIPVAQHHYNQMRNI